MGFDFGQIGGILSKYFDNDRMDISRFMQIQVDGRWREENVLLYPDVPCHIDFDSADNPDPATSDTQPINVGVTIICPIYVDLQNGDFITARKRDIKGNVLDTYSGLIGKPQTRQSRKRANLAMEKG